MRHTRLASLATSLTAALQSHREGRLDVRKGWQQGMYRLDIYASTGQSLFFNSSTMIRQISCLN